MSTTTSAPVTFAEKRPHATRSGQSALQMLHDQAAASGAVCSPKNADPRQRPAGFHSQAELTALQRCHDLAVEGGAKCATLEAPAVFSVPLVLPSEASTVSGLSAARRRELLQGSPMGRAQLWQEATAPYRA